MGAVSEIAVSPEVRGKFVFLLSGHTLVECVYLTMLDSNTPVLADAPGIGDLESRRSSSRAAVSQLLMR